MNTYASLYPLISAEVKGCPKNYIMLALYLSAEKFCDLTESWVKKMTGISIVANLDSYEIPIVYDARVKRIEYAWIKDQPQDPDWYELVWSGTTPYIRFNTNYIPTEAVTAGSAWATGTAYVVGNYVMYHDANYKCVTAHTSGTWATDVTAGYWDLADNALDIQVCLVPRLETNEFETNWFERWGIRAILAGAIADLKSKEGEPWADPQGAKRYGNQFSVSVSEAKANKQRQNKGGDQRVVARMFV